MKQPFNRYSYSLVINGSPVASSDFDNVPQIQATVSDVYGGGMVIAKISIYNLSKFTRDAIATNKGVIVLTAGQGLVQGVIFVGMIVNASTQTPNMTDNVLELLCNSSPITQDLKIIPTTFPTGTSVKSVISAVAAQSLKTPIFKGVFPQVLTRPLTLSGKFNEVMRKLGRAYKFTHKLNATDCAIISRYYVDPVVVDLGLSQDFLGGTMLTDQGCTINCHLKPFVKPFTNVLVKSLAPIINKAGAYIRETTVQQGVFKVISVVHTLDYYNSQWSTELQCIRS